jgi:hypothetical protein
MQLETQIIFDYDSEKVAGYVASLIQVDNEIAPRTLKINTSAEENKVVTKISSKKVGTFFATIDDLLFSEKLIADLLQIEETF